MSETKKQEVESVKTVKGKIKWFGDPNNPLPIIWVRMGKALRYMCTGMIVLVSGSPIFTASQSTVWTFWLGAGILISGGIELMVGIEPTVITKN